MYYVCLFFIIPWRLNYINLFVMIHAVPQMKDNILLYFSCLTIMTIRQ